MNTTAWTASTAGDIVIALGPQLTFLSRSEATNLRDALTDALAISAEGEPS